MSFDLDLTEGFKNRRPSVALSSLLDMDHHELEHGSRVPHLDMYFGDQIALLCAIEEIKASWTCEEHGTCFISPEAKHIQMIRFRLAAWGAAVVAQKCVASDPPLAGLLQNWGVGSSKPHGHSSSDTVPTSTPAASSSDATALVLAAVLPVIGMMAQNVAGSGTTSRSKRRRSLTPLSSPICPSSPPPAVEDELDIFVAAFGKAKNISEDVLTVAGNGLGRAHYMPDVLFEDSVSFDCLQDLTGLAEGQVHALRKFSREWSGKIAAKRAKQGI